MSSLLLPRGRTYPAGARIPQWALRGVGAPQPQPAQPPARELGCACAQRAHITRPAGSRRFPNGSKRGQALLPLVTCGHTHPPTHLPDKPLLRPHRWSGSGRCSCPRATSTCECGPLVVGTGPLVSQPTIQWTASTARLTTHAAVLLPAGQANECSVVQQVGAKTAQEQTSSCIDA